MLNNITILQFQYYNCWHFDIYKHDKFHAQLSRALKTFHNLGFNNICSVIFKHFGVTLWNVTVVVCTLSLFEALYAKWVKMR